MEVKDIVKGTAFSSDYLSIVNNNGVVTISVASGIATSTYKYIVF